MPGWWSHRHRQKPPAPDETAAGLAPGDVAELDHTFAAVESDQATVRDTRIVATLRPLVDRRVPVRVVEAAPGLHAARVRFADGTVVLARGIVPSDAGVLARWVHEGSVVLVACAAEVDGTLLEFRADRHRNSITLRLTGLDQPD